MLKYGNTALQTTLTKLLNKILDTSVILLDWHKSITTPIFKKGDKTIPDNYRGIILLCSALKLFTGILKTKLIHNQHGRTIRISTEPINHWCNIHYQANQGKDIGIQQNSIHVLHKLYQSFRQSKVGKYPAHTQWKMSTDQDHKSHISSQLQQYNQDKI
jgi:hypothetical protein